MRRDIWTTISLLVLTGVLTSCDSTSRGSGSPDSGTLRATAIQADRLAIERQIESLGGWEGWWRQIQPYSDALSVKLDEVDTTGYSNFLGQDNFVFRRQRLDYIRVNNLLFSQNDDPTTSSTYKAITNLNDQLRARGIDLIVIPVPSRGEIYPDKYIPGTATNPPVTPHRTEIIQALLEADVEVIDLMPLFTRMRDVGNPALYLKSHSHWSLRGIDLAAQEIAWRLGRYPEIAQADTQEYTSTVVRTTLASPIVVGLPPEIAATYEVPPIFTQQVREESGELYREDRDSPVLLIGDSYVAIFTPEQGDLGAQLARYLGSPVTNLWRLGAGPDVPQILADQGADYINKRRVIIWVYVTRYMFGGLDDAWVVADLP